MPVPGGYVAEDQQFLAPKRFRREQRPDRRSVRSSGRTSPGAYRRRSAGFSAKRRRFGAAGVYPVTDAGPKWKSWLKQTVARVEEKLEGVRHKCGKSRRGHGPCNPRTFRCRQQRRRDDALAPRTVQNMPERFKRAPITFLQPASTTPEPTNNGGEARDTASARRCAQVVRLVARANGPTPGSAWRTCVRLSPTALILPCSSLCNNRAPTFPPALIAREQFRRQLPQMLLNAW